MNSCFFIGHADAPEEVFAQLTQTVERLIVKAIPHRKKVPYTAKCDIINSWINR